MASRITFLLFLAVTSAAKPPLARAEITAEQVNKAIDEGVSFLKREQDRRLGTWPEHTGYDGGVTALCTLALLNSGVPADDPAVARAVEFLRKKTFDKTYVVSLQTLVFCALRDKKSMLLLRKNVDWLETTQITAGNRSGSWGYPDGNGDNSNTQFALLALHEADRFGVEVKEETWKSALAYWRRSQNDDGSWGYEPGTLPRGSMTSAGIGSVIMARDRLDQGDARVEGNRVICCGGHESDRTIENGLRWLGQKFSVTTNPGMPGGQVFWYYYLYGVERVGRLSNLRHIGQHDWYREVAEVLVSQQIGLSGAWKGADRAEQLEPIATSLALLFLAKGRRPVLAAKLKHQPNDDWNLHRGDLDKLVSYCESKWERDLTWQIIDAGVATADDLSESPVLFISGQKNPEFSDEQARKLREYINRGGFIFAEAACGGAGFDEGFRDLIDRMFPEEEYKLRLLPPEHLVWNAEEVVDPKFARELYGIDIGCRTSVIYCPDNLGCFWDLSRVGGAPKYPKAVMDQIAAARAIGVNVMAYATNREPRYKLDNPRATLAKETKDAFERAKIYIAKVRHSGGWNAAPAALANMLRLVSSKAGLRLSTESRELDLAGKNIFDYHLVFMHGRTDFKLSDVERKTLQTYIANGGVVMADAVCASEAFATAFRREMETAFDGKVEPIPAGDPIWTEKYGGFDLKTVTRRDPRRGGEGALKATGIQGAPELEGVKFGDRWGVIFSKYDLSCALELHDALECPGYSQEDAVRISLNIVLYSMFPN